MSDRMRLLFTASPAYGHLLPLLPMLRAAMTAGHDVRLATGPDMVGPMRARSVPAYGVGATWDEIVAERDEEAGRAHAEDLDAQRVVSASVLFGRAAAWRLPGLLDMAGRWRPDVVVHEPLELGGVMLARHLGLPSVTHGFGPMFREYGALGPIVAGATGDPGVWDEMLAGTALDICPPALRPPGAALWPEALDLRPSAGEAGGREVFDPGPARALRRPLVYVTLGTISNAIPGLMAGMVEALRSLSVDLVVTTGPGVDPASLGPQPAHVTVRQFVPQDQVLRHADLMVSHAGSRHHARRPLPRAAAALPAPRRRPALERRGSRAGPGRDRGAGGGVHARGRPGRRGDAAVVAVLPGRGAGGPGGDRGDADGP